MKAIGIISNPQKDKGFVFAEKMSDFISSEGCKPRLSFDTGEDFFDGLSFVIALGGDGTVLHAAKAAAVYNIPLLGINLGNLGFLTGADKDDWSDAVRCVIAGKYSVERRMMIEAAVWRNGEICATAQQALNDVCVTRGGAFGRIISLSLYVNGGFVDSYSGDGLIVATPTGSMAYNLSAGGPMLTPNAEMVAVTPICPHDLQSRSWVFSSDDEVIIKIGSYEKKDIMLVLDGRPGTDLCEGDIIKVNKSQLQAQLIKTNTTDFFEVWRKKIVNKD